LIEINPSPRTAIAPACAKQSKIHQEGPLQQTVSRPRPFKSTAFEQETFEQKNLLHHATFCTKSILHTKGIYTFFRQGQPWQNPEAWA
jgi:hypothetical protein